MTEESLARELARRADGVHGAPLSLDDVRSTARGIRRRRRAGAAAAVAALVAAAVIVPSVLTGGSHRSAPDPAPAPPTTPGVSVLHDGVVTRPDGSTVDLGVRNQDVQQLVVLTDGRVVMAMSKPFAVQVYEPDGSLQRQYPVQANVLTASAADDAVAWVAEDFTVRVLASGSAEPTELPGIPMPGESAGSIDAVLDPEHLLVGDHTTTTGELTPAGVRDLGTSEPLRVADVTEDGDLWAVSFLPTADQQYGCTGLYDPAGDQVVARSCDVYVLRFSPDGEHLMSAYYENNMASDVSVVDLDLHQVGSFVPAVRTTAVSRAGWADADHLVAGVADIGTRQWSLVRSGLDGGDAEVLDGPAPGGDPELTADYLVSE